MVSGLDKNELVAETLRLTLLCLQGDATKDEQERLNILLAESEDSRLIYLFAADDTVTLTESSTLNELGKAEEDVWNSTVFEHPQEIQHTPLRSERSERHLRSRTPSAWSLRNKRLRFYVGGALACLVLIAGALAFWPEVQSGFQAANTQSKLEQGNSHNVPLNEDLVTPEPHIMPPTRASTFSGRIVDVAHVEWSPGAPHFEAWSRITVGDQLQFETGVVELMLDNGAQIVLQGPADFRLVSARKAIARHGKLVMRCGPDAVGFEVESPDAKIIDLGTVFGLSIVEGASTDVVVYEGAVDLSIRASAGSQERRLSAGEALHIARNGDTDRIAAVQNPLFLPPPDVLGRSHRVSNLIGSVSDSLLPGETSKFYRVIARGFDEDCRAYVDRLHEWNGLDSQGIPRFLLGGDYVMTFNDDKLRKIRIALELQKPAIVYVLMDDRVSTPDWLSADFVDTGWDIGLDAHITSQHPSRFKPSQLVAEVGPGQSVDSVFSVWQQEVPVATVVELGSLRTKELEDVDPYSVKQSMYGVVVKPLPNRRSSR